MLTKGFDIGFKDVDVKQGIVKGQFCAHNIKDLGGDISIYGSLKKTIEERGPNGKKLIKFCLNHERKGLPGVLKELWEENSGGFYAAKAGSNNAGVDFLKMVESDIINQHSYGYIDIKTDFDTSLKANILRELKLLEVSAVEFLGMNPETTYIEMKSATEWMEYLNRLEKFIRTTDCTDETIQQLELKLHSLTALLKPDNTTSKDQEAEKIKELFKTFGNHGH
jgi:phage head maturation protease